MCLAAEAAHLQKDVSGIERIPQRWRRLRGPPKPQHALIPRLASELVGLLPGRGRALLRNADRAAVHSIARFGAHARAECAPRGMSGKPLSLGALARMR